MMGVFAMSGKVYDPSSAVAMTVVEVPFALVAAEVGIRLLRIKVKMVHSHS